MKLIIDVDDKDYELLNKTGIEIDWNTAFHGKEKDREMTFAIFDLVKALKQGTPYKEMPQGKWHHSGECSVCHKRSYKTTPLGEIIGLDFTDFCKNCGADMRGEKYDT